MTSVVIRHVKEWRLWVLNHWLSNQCLVGGASMSICSQSASWRWVNLITQAITYDYVCVTSQTSGQQCVHGVATSLRVCDAHSARDAANACACWLKHDFPREPSEVKGCKTGYRGSVLVMLSCLHILASQARLTSWNCVTTRSTDDVMKPDGAAMLYVRN